MNPQNCTQDFVILPKWRNFAKSGHTDHRHRPRLQHRRRAGEELLQKFTFFISPFVFGCCSCCYWYADVAVDADYVVAIVVDVVAIYSVVVTIDAVVVAIDAVVVVAIDAVVVAIDAVAAASDTIMPTRKEAFNSTEDKLINRFR